MSFVKSLTCIMILLLAIRPGDASAQNAALGKWEIGARATLARMVSENKAFSSLPFAGTGGGGSLGISYRKGQVLNQLTIRFLSGQLRHGGTDLLMRRNYSTLDLVHLYMLVSGPVSNWRMAAGGGINMIYAKNSYQLRINNQPAMDGVASFSAAASFEYDFLEGFSVSERIYVPFASFIQQPSFSMEGTDKSKILAASFGNFFRIVNLFNIKRQAGKNGSISIAYHFDYSTYYEKTVTRQAVYGFEAGYTFKL